MHYVNKFHAFTYESARVPGTSSFFLKSANGLSFKRKPAVENIVESVNNFLLADFRYGYGEPKGLRKGNFRAGGA